MIRPTLVLKSFALVALSATFIASCEPLGEEGSSPEDDTKQTLTSGFVKTRIASGLKHPTTLAVAPDGRIFVLERGTGDGGTARIRVIKNGSLLSTPFASITVDDVSISANERGLLG